MIELIVKKPSVELNASVGGYAEGYEKGYQSGHKEGQQEGYYDGLNEGLQVGFSDGYQMGYDEGNTEGLNEGYQEAYDTFWDMFQEDGNRTDYRYAFGYTKWNDETFNPKYPLKFIGDASYAFIATEVVWADRVLQVDLSQATSLFWTFRNSKFTKIGKCDFSSATTISGVFSFCQNLESIAEIVSNESIVWDGTFAHSYNLANVNFSGVIGKSISFSNCSLLTSVSVNSIINALKDLSGATAQTLTLNATVGAKLTAEQKNAIKAKNWTLVY